MTNTHRSNERGIAMIIALFMVLAMSVLGTSLMFVSQSETMSSKNYRLMSQARYGAESGIHKAANYLLSAAYMNVEPGSVTDPLPSALYVTTTSPVSNNVGPIVLSSDPLVAQNYPVAGVKAAFAAAAAGALDVQDGTVSYTAHATLLSMRQINDQYTLLPETLQTWEITSTGRIAGAHTAEVEVSAIVEVQPMSLYSYAAFATSNQCAALSFAGGATTDSYDSSTLNPANPVFVADLYGGNVGTNGNLTEVGNPTTIHGSMSTPRSGVGACSANNVTAETIIGQASVSEGLTQLSQEIQFPTPNIPPLSISPPPNQSFTKTSGCLGVPNCVQTNISASDKGVRFTPPNLTTPVELGNVTVTGGATVHLNAGTYLINSIDIVGSSQIKIDSGPVIFKVVGENVTTPIKIAGNGISNPTLIPSNLEFQYAGTNNIDIEGGTDTAALFYAPNAVGKIGGGSDLYGSIVVKQMTATGGASIHYDRNLEKSALTRGNPMMSAFTWKNSTD